MDYSEINIKALQSVINNAISELSTHNLSSAANNISNSSALSTKVGTIAKDALNKIEKAKDANGSIAKLRENLNNLKKASEYIAKCQTLAKEIKGLENGLENVDAVTLAIIELEINNKKISLNSYETIVDNLL